MKKKQIKKKSKATSDIPVDGKERKPKVYLMNVH